MNMTLVEVYQLLGERDVLIYQLQKQIQELQHEKAVVAIPPPLQESE